MDQSPAQKAQDRSLGGPACARQDLRQRDIVEDAILMQQRSNTVTAVEYLKARGVAPGVIRRVLLGPASRRGPYRQDVAPMPQTSI